MVFGTTYCKSGVACPSNASYLASSTQVFHCLRSLGAVSALSYAAVVSRPPRFGYIATSPACEEGSALEGTRLCSACVTRHLTDGLCCQKSEATKNELNKISAASPLPMSLRMTCGEQECKWEYISVLGNAPQPVIHR